jgi:dipeptidyl aminopeptidase/acylaminoacyl peptidase
VALEGGAVVTVGEFTGGFARLATMNREGVVLFDGSGETSIRRTGGGGTTTAVTRLNPSRREQVHAVPEFLPDGQHFLFVASNSTMQRWDSSADLKLYIGSLGSTEVRSVVDVTGPARYAAGHLLYVRQRTLMARSFDPDSMESRGPEFPLADGVVAGLFSVSETGTIAYRPAESDYLSLVWFDRGGSRLGTLGESAEYRQVVLSPSGLRVAVVRGDPASTDLWIAESAKGVFSRVTDDLGNETDAAWSPDEKHLAFTKMGVGVVRKDLLTGAEQVVAAAAGMNLDDWTADGKFLICRGGGVFAVPAFGSGAAVRLPHVNIDETHVSADGHWVTYNSDESGEFEVYVASFPEFAGKQQVSVAGGVQPRWRRDGRELFFVTPRGEMMSAAIRTVPGLKIDTPKALFTTNLVPTPGWSQYSVTPDGQRFLIMESSRQFFTVLQNWLPAKAVTQ